MKERFVYCVLQSIDYEGDKLVAVYANKSDADEQAAAFNKFETSPGIGYRVEQRLVIANSSLSGGASARGSVDEAGEVGRG